MPDAAVLRPHRRHFSVGMRASGVALVALALLHSPAKAIDEFFPTFGNPGIDVRHYALRLDVKGKSERVAGRAVLTIEATSRLPEFSLDLSNLSVRSVEIDGVAARYRQHPGKLTIRPAATIAKGQRFKVAIEYGGVPVTIPDPTADDPSTLPGLGWTDLAGRFLCR